MEATHGEVVPAAQMAQPSLETPLIQAWGTGCLAPHPIPPSFPFHSRDGLQRGVGRTAKSKPGDLKCRDGGGKPFLFLNYKIEPFLGNTSSLQALKSYLFPYSSNQEPAALSH